MVSIVSSVWNRIKRTFTGRGRKSEKNERPNARIKSAPPTVNRIPTGEHAAAGPLTDRPHTVQADSQDLAAVEHFNRDVMEPLFSEQTKPDSVDKTMGEDVAPEADVVSGESIHALAAEGATAGTTVVIDGSCKRPRSSSVSEDILCEKKKLRGRSGSSKEVSATPSFSKGLLLEVFEDSLVERLCSEKWDVRCEALKQVAKQLEEDPSPDETPGWLRQKTFNATCCLVQRSLSDKIAPVFFDSLDVIRTLVETQASAMHRDDLAACLGAVLPQLVARIGDSNSRVHEAACHSILFLTRHPAVGGVMIFPYVCSPSADETDSIKDDDKQRAGKKPSLGKRPRHVRGVLALLRKVIPEAGFSEQSGLSVNVVVGAIARPALDSPDEKLRRVAMAVVVESYRLAPRATRQYLKDVTNTGVLKALQPRLKDIDNGGEGKAAPRKTFAQTRGHAKSLPPLQRGSAPPLRTLNTNTVDRTPLRSSLSSVPLKPTSKDAEASFVDSLTSKNKNSSSGLGPMFGKTTGLFIAPECTESFGGVPGTISSPTAVPDKKYVRSKSLASVDEDEYLMDHLLDSVTTIKPTLS